MSRTSLVAGSVLALLLLGCGGTLEPSASPDPAEEQEAREAPAAPEAPEETDDPFADFDRDGSRELAESYLDVPEDEIAESGMVRVVRRGDEDFMVTMDLRPGRLNLELDDDGSGTYVVTRVKVETPDGQDPLIVE